MLIEQKLVAQENGFCRLQINCDKGEAEYELLSVFVGFCVSVGQPLLDTFDFELFSSEFLVAQVLNSKT